MRPRGSRRVQDERRREPQTRVNDMIRVREVLLIDDEGTNHGSVPTVQAQRYAEEKGLDLVEISPNARPPVVRVMDYGKYKYEMAIKAKEARRNRSQVIVKEIKFRPKIGKADYETKKNHVRRFLEADDKVKVTIMFRGREVVHNELGRDILVRVAEDCSDVGNVEQQPNLEGRNMTMVIGPAVKRQPAPRPAAPADGDAAPSEGAAPTNGASPARGSAPTDDASPIEDAPPKSSPAG